MATMHSDPKANGRDSTRRGNPPAGARPAASVLDLLGPDDPLHKEMEHLLAEKPPAQQTDGPAPSPETETSDPNVAVTGELVPLSENEALAVLRVENAQLRARVEELEQMLEATTNQAEQLWAEQQKEYELLLDEKSEVIRSLHQQLQEAKQQESASTTPVEAIGDDPVALRKELAVLRAQMEQERLQLEQDEKALMDQMREMELALSRERVEMARQRSELQRLHKDLQHEIERAEKEGGLRDRLIALQRRSQAEASTHTAPPRTPQPAPGHPTTPRQVSPARRSQPTQNALARPERENNGNRPSSGFLRRLFG